MTDENGQSRFLTPSGMHLAPGTLLRDGDGRFWMVRDDGQTAAGTNGGVMVDLRRGDVVWTPSIPPESANTQGVDRG